MPILCIQETLQSACLCDREICGQMADRNVWVVIAVKKTMCECIISRVYTLDCIYIYFRINQVCCFAKNSLAVDLSFCHNQGDRPAEKWRVKIQPILVFRSQSFRRHYLCYSKFPIQYMVEIESGSLASMWVAEWHVRHNVSRRYMVATPPSIPYRVLEYYRTLVCCSQFSSCMHAQNPSMNQYHWDLIHIIQKLQATILIGVSLGASLGSAAC